IVAGNVLLYLPPEGGARVFPLSRYVVKRDPMGEVIEVIVKETMSRATLPEDIQQMLMAQEGDLPSDQNNKKSDEINLYTKMVREGNKYMLYQEVEGMKIPDSYGKYPLDKAPML
ncbi:portal protein, partial [Klebsiella pneumoniae]|uniref:portal protein n=1 Tax=Klebsiella pneumoniae TaxID=573 RepID=UPI0039C4D7DB